MEHGYPLFVIDIPNPGCKTIKDSRNHFERRFQRLRLAKYYIIDPEAFVCLKGRQKGQH